MSNNGVLSIEHIREVSAPIMREFEVKTASLFGSYGAGTATAESDVDFLIQFAKERPTIFDLAGLQNELQTTLKISVDVVTVPNPNLRLKIGQTVLVYAQ